MVTLVFSTVATVTDSVSLALLTRRLVPLLMLCTSVAVAQEPNDDRLRAGWAAFEAGDARVTLRLLEPLAQSGNKYAQYAVAEMLVRKHATTHNVMRAATLFLAAAEQDVPAAQTRIGTAYFHGEGVAQDYALALSWFRRGAANGHASAQTNLAVMLADGIGAPRNPQEAMRWLNEALPRGEANTFNTLANAYARGDGVAIDQVRAISLYRQAAAYGHTVAMDNLGNAYREGLGVPKDYAQARHWYELAAARSEAKSLTNLGILYLRGLGVEKDFKKAGDYLRMATQRSDAEAEFHLGTMFLYGQGTPQDRDIGTRWMALSAAHGHEIAKAHMIVLANTQSAIAEDQRQLQTYSNVLGATARSSTKKLLGDLFSNGVLVPPNLSEARRWYLLAARHGDADAAARARALE